MSARWANSSLDAGGHRHAGCATGTIPEPDQHVPEGAADAVAPDLCLDENGDDVDRQAAASVDGSMSTTRANLDDFQFTEINSDIYQYRHAGSRRAGVERAEDRAQTCAGNIEIDI